MINVVKYKTNRGYNDAVKTGNTANSIILQTHEPFRIIVFSDAKPVRRDPRVVSRITEIGNLDEIPTGNALLAVNGFYENNTFNTDIINQAYTLIKNYNLKIVEELRHGLSYVVELPESLSFTRFVSQMNKTYNGQSIFSVIEEDVIFEAQSCDYYAWPYSSQWHLSNIEAQEAYELLDNGNYNSEAGVTYGEWHTRDVAILDGHGFEFTHPDLDNNEYPNNHPGRYMTRSNWDCVLNNNNPQPAGLNDKHGTVMAGIAASGWADRRFLRGVGLDHINAQCLRVGYNVTITGTFSTSTSIIVRGLNKAAINGNCASIVMPFSQLYYSPFTNLYLNKIKIFGRFGKGMPIFAASGNNALSQIDTTYPASYAAVMAIGASTQTNTKAPFSNYGEGLFATAPGVSIFAIDRCCGRGYNINPDLTYGSVTYFTGTSAASVIAATIAATMVVADPNITELKIRSILAITARRLGPYTYESESNEIGLDLGISLETGNGILTQADAIQMVLDTADELQQEYINYQINDFNIRWSENNNGPWSTAQPIPAGAYLQGDINYTITNTGPNILITGNPIPIGIYVTLEEDGPIPTEETPMLQIAGSSDTGIAVEPGDSVTRTEGYFVERGGLTCGLDGNYYLVMKFDPYNAVAETSEEDNFRAEAVSFTMDHPIPNSNCSLVNYLPLGPSGANLRLCFYDTGLLLDGQSTLGNPNYLVGSATVTRNFNNAFPDNENLKLNSVSAISFGGTLWYVTIQVTNLGSSNIQEFSVDYQFGPSLATLYDTVVTGKYLGTCLEAGNCGQLYIWNNTIQGPICGNISNVRDLSYITQYPAALDWEWDIPAINNPLLPNETRTFSQVINFHYPVIYYPAILTAKVKTTNYRYINNLLPIHVKQSNIIYG